MLQRVPFSFDGSVWELFWPLANGMRLVLARPDGHHEPAYLAQVIPSNWGGHSLLAVNLVARMRKAGLEVDARSVFSQPTTYWKVLIEAMNVNLTRYGTIFLRSPIRGCAPVCVESTVLAHLNVDKKRCV